MTILAHEVSHADQIIHRSGMEVDELVAECACLHRTISGRTGFLLSLVEERIKREGL
ncbi:MAG: hypothetical protein WBM50_02590 [Acidimicrobiales bacterium]